MSFVECERKATIHISHRRMIHAKEAAIGDMVNNPSYDIKANIHPENLKCETCVQTSGTKQPNSGRLVEHLQALNIHENVYGPFKQNGSVTSNYF